MVEVVYEWARGMSFNRITDLTDVMEGTIVRVITRLDETCREVKNAARIIGDPVLFQKMGTCQELIKRYVRFISTGIAGPNLCWDSADEILTGTSATAQACTYKSGDGVFRFTREHPARLVRRKCVSVPRGFVPDGWFDRNMTFDTT